MKETAPTEPPAPPRTPAKKPAAIVTPSGTHVLASSDDVDFRAIEVGKPLPRKPAAPVQRLGKGFVPPRPKGK